MTDRHPMTLNPGTRLGPYEVLAPIGAGGMGEVYKAKDTRLDRIVAIKVLPEHLSEHPELRQRFEQEARAVSSLNHPHICTLYDVGHENGVDFLVMEYIEGETLADRLAKGPLPLEEALEYAFQIADALDKAHRHGVVHRDLKPGNIMITSSGAKLLDFGLAKLQPGGRDAPDLSAVTEPKPLTEKGAILGTFQYMAPEQLEGGDVDARTDIFAFGALLYEMVTGRRAFEGKSQASLIGAILKDVPPPLSTLSPMSPPALDHLAKICLAKDPSERWQTAGDIRRQLKWISEEGTEAGRGAPVPIGPRRTTPFVFALALVAIVAALLASIATWNLKPTPAADLMRFTVSVPPGNNRAALIRGLLAISPDGTRLAYVARHPLYVRALDQVEPTLIRDTENALYPFFSPDGQWVGYSARGELRKVSVNGGVPTTLSQTGIWTSASWTPDNTIVFVSDGRSISRVSASGGTPETLVSLGEEEETGSVISDPQILPGGRFVLFTLADGFRWDDAIIVAESLESGERTVLVEGGTHARYLPTGHIVYVRAETLLAVPLNLERMEVTGAPVPILQGVLQATPPRTGVAHFDVSDTGSLIYVPSRGESPMTQLVWVDREGIVSPWTEPEAHTLQIPRVSPDGRRLAVEVADEVGRHVWIYDVARGARSQLTFEGTNNFEPTWIPDGTKVAFSSDRLGEVTTHWKASDGSGEAELLLERDRLHFPASWSPDGRLLAIYEFHPENQADVWVVSVDDGTTSPVTTTEFAERSPMFSPNGNWIAYQSDRSGRPEVYVQPYPGTGGRRRISTDGGTEPLWARDGKEIFFRNEDEMMVVAIDTNEGFQHSAPRALFSGNFETDVNVPNYDVHPHGDRFVMIRSLEMQALEIHVVVNWFEQLKRLVPVR